MAVELFSANGPRWTIPRGPLALAALAVAIVPILWKELTKGKKEEEEKEPTPESKPDEAPAAAAAQSAGTQRPTAKPKASVKPKTTKQGAKAAGVDVTTSSPTGHEEMAENIAAEMDGAAPKPPKRTTPKKPTARKAPPADQPTNPKRTRNSRPS